MKTRRNRKKVTFEFNREDVLKVIASAFEEGTPYKWIDFPQPNYASSTADMVMKDGRMVGMSMFNATAGTSGRCSASASSMPISRWARC